MSACRAEEASVVPIEVVFPPVWRHLFGRLEGNRRKFSVQPQEIGAGYSRSSSSTRNRLPHGDKGGVTNSRLPWSPAKEEGSETAKLRCFAAKKVLSHLAEKTGRSRRYQKKRIDKN